MHIPHFIPRTNRHSEFSGLGRENPSSGTLAGPRSSERGTPRMSSLYVAVLAVIVVALLSVALIRTSLVKTKAD